MRFKDVFEHAYDGVSVASVNFTEHLLTLLEIICVCMIYLTIPIWFIPYSIVKRKDDKSER